MSVRGRVASGIAVDEYTVTTRLLGGISVEGGNRTARITGGISVHDMNATARIAGGISVHDAFIVNIPIAGSLDVAEFRGTGVHRARSRRT